MRRRAFGIETEYGVVQLRGTIDLKDALMGPLRREYLPNGARCYLDQGGHPEYATPECDDLDELVAHVLAGDRHVAARLEKRLQQQRRYQSSARFDLRVFRNNISGYGSGQRWPFGAHENYSVEDRAWPVFSRPLLPYLVTRQLVLGAGRLRINGSNWRVDLAQRSAFLAEALGHNTTYNRPIFNERDERHARTGRRLHNISGDSHFLPQLIKLQAACMDVLLTMIEEDRPLRHQPIEEPAEAVADISCDPAHVFGLAEGGHTTALDVQQRYFDQAWAFVDSDSELAAKRAAIVPWGRHLDRLRRSLAPEDHVGELEWATKAVVLQQFREAHPEASQARFRACELSLHQITGQPTGLTVMHRRFGQYDPAAVERALVQPPQTTRARVRGWATTIPELQVNSWSYVNIMRPGQAIFKTPVPLDDPLDPTVPAELAPYLT